MNALVGYTGFVGSNIYEKGSFNKVFNSKNIKDAYGLKPELLVYAGLRAEKYLANAAPAKDMALIEQAEENIEKIGPKKLVLISTIDVFQNPAGKTEDDPADADEKNAYGYNRLKLEEWTKEHFSDALIVRLPGLFGKNIKKNFIYDFINRIPFMLKEEKFEELAHKCALLYKAYEKTDNGFYRLKDVSAEQKKELKEAFNGLGFSALNFTDSRSVYQFYPLSRLCSDIELALEKGITLLHTAVEGISAGELYEYLTDETFKNELSAPPAFYDYRTLYAEAFGRSGSYILSKKEVMDEIRDFVSLAQQHASRGNHA